MTPDDPPELEAHPTTPTIERVARLESRVATLERVARGLVETLAWVVFAGPATILILKLDRPRELMWPHVFDITHVVLSAAVALIALRLSRQVLAGVLRSSTAHYLVAIAAAAIVGAGLEILQIVTKGGPSLRDFVRDLGGALAAVLGASSFDGERRAQRWRLRAAALLALCLPLVPTAKAIRAYVLRRAAFPALVDFEDSWQTRFLDSNDGVVFTLEPPPAAFTRARGRSVANVLFHQGAYAEFELSDLFGDWSPYTSLIFDVYSTEAAPVSLELTVRDQRRRDDRTGRYSTRVTIAPAQSTVAISLAAVRDGPTRRPMDMAKIRSITLSMSAPDRPITLYFDSFRLE